MPDGTAVQWMYYDEYLKASPEEIKHRLLLITKAHSKKVIGLNNKKIFINIVTKGAMLLFLLLKFLYNNKRF